MTPRKYAEKMVAKWAGPFGFAHYTILVEDLPEDLADKCWVQVTGHCEEEWLLIRIGTLADLSNKQVEHVMVHELTHALLQFGAAADVTEEMVCNRVANMLVGQQYGLRALPTMLDNLTFTGASRAFSDDEREALEGVMPHLIVRLPEKYRSVLCAIFYDGKSLNELARDEGVAVTTIQARRNQAIAALRALMMGNN